MEDVKFACNARQYSHIKTIRIQRPCVTEKERRRDMPKFKSYIALLTGETEQSRCTNQFAKTEALRYSRI